jgi:hypothetical protein
MQRLCFLKWARARAAARADASDHQPQSPPQPIAADPPKQQQLWRRGGRRSGQHRLAQQQVLACIWTAV